MAGWFMTRSAGVSGSPGAPRPAITPVPVLRVPGHQRSRSELGLEPTFLRFCWSEARHFSLGALVSLRFSPVVGTCQAAMGERIGSVAGSARVRRALGHVALRAVSSLVRP
jgi:hypothetical protein